MQLICWTEIEDQSANAATEVIGRSNKRTSPFGKLFKKRPQIITEQMDKSRPMLLYQDLKENCIEEIPDTIMDMLRILRSQGPYTVGIFRKSPRHSQYMEVRQCMETQQHVNFDGVPVIVLTALIKDFLRRMPDCLLLAENYDGYMQTIDMKDFDRRISTLKRLLSRLPRLNLEFLKYLMCIFYHIKENATDNSMDAHNLAVCSGHSLLWPQKSGDSKSQTGALHNVPDFIEFLIEHSVQVLGEDIPVLLNDERPGHIPNRQDSSKDSDSIQGLPSFQGYTGRSDDASVDSLDFDGSVPSSPHVPRCRASHSSLDSGFALSDTQCEDEDVFYPEDQDTPALHQDHQSGGCTLPQFRHVLSTDESKWPNSSCYRILNTGYTHRTCEETSLPRHSILPRMFLGYLLEENEQEDVEMEFNQLVLQSRNCTEMTHSSAHGTKVYSKEDGVDEAFSPGYNTSTCFRDIINDESARRTFRRQMPKSSRPDCYPTSASQCFGVRGSPKLQPRFTVASLFTTELDNSAQSGTFNISTRNSGFTKNKITSDKDARTSERSSSYVHPVERQTLKKTVSQHKEQKTKCSPVRQGSLHETELVNNNHLSKFHPQRETSCSNIRQVSLSKSSASNSIHLSKIHQTRKLKCPVERQVSLPETRETNCQTKVYRTKSLPTTTALPENNMYRTGMTASGSDVFPTLRFFSSKVPLMGIYV